MFLLNILFLDGDLHSSFTRWTSFLFFVSFCLYFLSCSDAVIPPTFSRRVQVEIKIPLHYPCSVPVALGTLILISIPKYDIRDAIFVPVFWITMTSNSPRSYYAIKLMQTTWRLFLLCHIRAIGLLMRLSVKFCQKWSQLNIDIQTRDKGSIQNNWLIENQLVEALLIITG